MHKTIQLSQKSIGDLRRSILKLKQSLKDGELTSDIINDFAKVAQTEVESEVYALGVDVDGNSIGDVETVANPAIEGATVRWVGEQISYIEFGTGARGYYGWYPSQSFMHGLGFYPDPTKQVWVYRNQFTGDETVSYGLTPQAPMYRAARTLRNSHAFGKIGAKRLRETLENDIFSA